MACEYEKQEQILIRALHHGQLHEAARLLASLQAQIPHSVRVRRLQAKLHAARGQANSAVEICDEIIANDASDIVTWKTLISCQKGVGRLDLSISTLLALVNLVPSDINCWRELADLYIRQRQFSYALFAFEELLLLRPACYSSYLMCAEVLVTIGDKKSIDQAKQYYAMSIELNPNRNARALYGLLLLCKGNSPKRPILQELHEFALKKLMDLYKTSNSNLVRFVRSMAAS